MIAHGEITTVKIMVKKKQFFLFNYIIMLTVITLYTYSGTVLQEKNMGGITKIIVTFCTRQPTEWLNFINFCRKFNPQITLSRHATFLSYFR